jgi:hypothetical protein
MTAITEEQIEDARQFFYGEGSHAAMARLFGGSLTAYPDSDDPNQQAICALCAELERRGHVRARELPADGRHQRAIDYYGPLNWEWAAEEQSPQK